MTTAVKTTSGGLLGLHAQTALHPGSGTALGTVDLPVQREKHTQWPNIAGSALKGILRDACREQVKARYEDDPADDKKARLTRRDKANADPDLVDVFGPPTNASSEAAAGALSVTDARLLAFPVRSLKGVFAWITCHAVLDRFQRDAHLVGVQPTGAPAKPEDEQAVVSAAGCDCLAGDSLVLEEFEFKKVDGDAADIALWIAKHLLPQTPPYAGTVACFPRRFVVLSNDYFTHFARYATEIMARVGLNYDTKTVKDGALFYQEFLPAETLFYSVVLANAARARFGTKDAAAVLQILAGHLPPVLQIGGDETTGKGFCAVRLTSAEGEN